MAKQKINMKPGKKYHGYGYINEYGEMHFEPSQPSESKNRLKLVFSTDKYSIYETGCFYKISLKIPKEPERVIAYKKLMLVFQAAVAKMATYL